MTENTVKTASASPAELDFSAIWAGCVASIAPESSLRPELCKRTGANLDLVLGGNDQRIDEFLDWARQAQLPPLHMAFIARYCLEKHRAQEALVFANKAFASHPRELSIANLVEECQKSILGDSRAANMEGAFCRKPFEQFEISPDGDVYLCCSAWLPKSIGNIHNQKWDEIWNSAAAQEIRESIHDGSFRHCSSHLCPLIASNTLWRASAEREPRLRDIIDNRKVVLEGGPRVVNLSNDETCNLACPSCRTKLIVAKGERRNQLGNVAKEVILPLLKNSGTVSITGSGDPFASHYFRYILKETNRPEYAHLQLYLQTNGVLFDEKAWADLNLEGRVDRVMVSLDASSESTYRVVRKGGDFQRLMQNLRFIAGLRHQNRFKHLRLDFVVQWRNFRDLPGFVGIGRALGADAVFLQTIYNWGTFTQEKFLKESITNPNHPDFATFLEVLRSPTLDWEKIEWGNIQQFRDHAVSSGVVKEVAPALTHEGADLENALAAAQDQSDVLAREKAALESALAAAQDQGDALAREKAELKNALAAIQDQGDNLSREKAALENALADVWRSLSWRITAPLRSISGLVRTRILKSTWLKTSHKTLPEAAVADALHRYFVLGDRSSDLVTERCELDGCLESIPLLLARTELHDQDYQIFRHFREGTILDIGANNGYSACSIWASGSGCSVLSFEPIGGYAPSLQMIRSLREGRYDFRIIALGDSTDEVRLVAPVLDGHAVTALTSGRSDVCPGLAELIAQRAKEIGATELRLCQFVSPVERLDDVLIRDGFRLDVSHIPAIKIDVEGMEGAVLRGAVRTLVTYRPLVMAESGYWAEDVAGYLRDLGFKFGIRDGNTIHASDDPGTTANGIFIHPSQFAAYRKIGLMH